MNKLSIYLGREALSLKMGSVLGGSTSGLMLIGSRPDDTFFVVARTVLEKCGLDCRPSLFSLK